MRRLVVTMLMTLALAGLHPTRGDAQTPAGLPAAAPPAAASAGGVVLPRPALQPPRPVRRLSVDEAVTLALEQNLDLRVERINPLIQDTFVAEARSVYAPELSTTVTGDDWDRPAGNIFDGGDVGDEPLRAGRRGRRAAGALEGRPVLGGMDRPALDHHQRLHELQPAGAVDLEPELHAAAGAQLRLSTASASRSRSAARPATSPTSSSGASSS